MVYILLKEKSEKNDLLNKYEKVLPLFNSKTYLIFLIKEEKEKRDLMEENEELNIQIEKKNKIIEKVFFLFLIHFSKSSKFTLKNEKLSLEIFSLKEKLVENGIDFSEKTETKI